MTLHFVGSVCNPSYLICEEELRTANLPSIKILYTRRIYLETHLTFIDRIIIRIMTIVLYNDGSLLSLEDFLRRVVDVCFCTIFNAPIVFAVVDI